MTSTTSEPLQVYREDIVALKHYVELWTDWISRQDALGQFKGSEFHTLQEFEQCNTLVNVGDSYVRINPELSILEFFSLIQKIPWTGLTLPDTQLIPYSMLSQLFRDADPTLTETISDQIAIRLMALGSTAQLWILLNPQQLVGTPVGTMYSIVISPQYLSDCQIMIDEMKNGIINLHKVTTP